MRMVYLTLGAGFFSLSLLGCGPLHSPMPPRLDPESQKSADEAWNNAFTPVGKLDHQTLLDAFLTTQAYQIGVDKLALRSEKQITQGLLVMEIHFDREKPNDDRFEVSVFDKNNQRIRHERYSRADMERTYGVLFPSIPEPGVVKQEPADWAAKREAANRRKAAVENLLPKVEEKPKDEAKPKVI